MTLVTIEVTQADIKAGGHGGCNCPVWRGASRALPGVADLWVASGYISDLKAGGGSNAWVPLPAEVARWITDYDDDGPAEPVSFELDVPEGWVTS